MLAITFLVFGSGAAFGQGWVKTYGDSTSGPNLIMRIFHVKDKIVALEHQHVAADQSERINYLTLNSDGTVHIRTRLDQKIDSLASYEIFNVDSLGNFYLYYNYWQQVGIEKYEHVRVIKIDDTGNIIKSKTLDGFLRFINDYNKFRVYIDQTTITYTLDDNLTLVRPIILDFQKKNLIWFDCDSASIVGADDDSLYMFTKDFELLWSKPHKVGNAIFEIYIDNGQIYLGTWEVKGNSSIVQFHKFDLDGNKLKESEKIELPRVPFATGWLPYKLRTGFALVVEGLQDTTFWGDLTFIDFDLNVVCSSLLLGFEQRFHGIYAISTFDSDLLVVGYGNPSHTKTQIARLSKYCSTSSNLLKINLFSDDNKDCIPSGNEKTLLDKLVRITNKDRLADYFSSTKDTIFAALDTGQYVIHPKAPMYYKLCVDSINISHQKYYDTIRLDIPLQTEVICPYLEVDISAPLLRRCFNNTYSVRYCNQGTALAKAAYIEVQLDQWMDYVSSTKPLSSQQGNLLRFDLGDLAVGDCGNFQIVSYLRCDSTVIGMTHCTDAHIFPDSLCLPSSGWDGSRIRVSGQCKGDSIEFEIRNASSSPMTQNSEYIVVEDEIIMMRKPFVLGANQSLRFGMPVYGRTYRVEAAQSQGHPGSSKPSVTIENCGTGPVSLGFVNQFAQDDADPFIDIDCQQSRGSYDPNDKQGFPTGYSVQKYIEPGQDIEYLIRFQNTGNDTAFTVRIHDTLSTFLDPTTIVPGASSHPYHYRLFGPGIIEFLFDPIALPDSTINKTGSIGFVKFTIEQKKDIPLGSVVYNAASIYFDYNAPIITNTTKHTIGKNFITITELKELSTTSLKVYPNPFSQEAVIELKDSDASEKTFELFDLQGRSIRREIFTNNQLIFKRNQLSSGLYFFKVTDRNGVLTQGKLVVES